MSSVITFSNHSPVRIADADLIETVWGSDQQWGHHLLKRYTTKRGNSIYWVSRNSGQQVNGREPETIRVYLPNVAAIRSYFAECSLEDVYHNEIEAEVDPAAIIDVDAIA